jgi:hypothetical protein
MGKINNYSKDAAVTASDKWVGSDFENNGSTKNFTPTSIAKYLNDNNVINIGSDLRYRYQTLNPGEVRGVGTISFESERGASVAFSGITTFLLSKRTLKQNDVSQYLQFLNGGSIIINSAENQNLFGFYNVVNLSEYALNNDFYSVELQYIAGNGGILEDTDYIFSLIKDKYSSTGKEQVNSDWNSTEGVSEILNKPTSLSEFTNDEGFITIDDVPEVNGIPVGGTTGQILTKASSEDYDAVWQENYADWTSVVKHTVKNNGVEVLLKGRPVYCTGSNGTNKLVGYAGNQSEATSSKTMGLLQSQLNINGSQSTGFVITEGLLGGLNTSSASAGDPVWLGPTGTLIYGLTNKPYAPAHLVFIGIVTKVSSGNGEIFVNIQNGFELNEIHDVDLKTTVPINGDLLGFDGTLWVNKTIAGWLGYTPFQLPALTNGSVLFSNGTTIAQDNANFFWDNTNKRLGIGTNTPSQLLSVAGNMNLSTGGFIYGNTLDASLRLTNGGGSILKFASSNIGLYSTLTEIVASNRVTTLIGASEITRVTSAGLGIGTTVVGARLDVRAQGALSTDIAFRVRNSADTLDTVQVRGDGVTNFNLATGQSISFTHAGGTRLNLDGTSVAYRTGNRIILGGGNDFLDFSTANSTKMTVNNLGNVSIGSTTAGARLDVRAQGALSTDISFRVRNSADTFDTINVNGVQATIRNNSSTSSTLRLQNSGGGRVLEFLDINGNAFQWIDQSGTRFTDVSGNYFIARTQGTAASPSYTISGLGGIGGVNGMMMFAMGGNRRMFLTSDGCLRLPASNDYGADLPHASAKLQLDATTQGFLPPRMTNAQRLAIASPAIGLIVYCTDMVEGLYVNKSTGWQFII